MRFASILCSKVRLPPGIIYSVPPDLLAGFKGPLRGGEGRGKGRKGKGGEGK